MPTILTHAAIPLAIGIGLGGKRTSRRLLLAGALAAMLPDLDVVAFRLGIPYADAFGHRGASHSLVAALAVGLLAALAAPTLRTTRLRAFLFIAASMFSHGLLDALTNGGHGVALWWPFSLERIFLPWRVIEVSPLTVGRFLGERGLTVLRSELIRVWLPAVSLCVALVMARACRHRMGIRSRERARD